MDWFWTAVVVWAGWTFAPVILILALALLFGGLYLLAIMADWIRDQWRRIWS